MGKTVNRSRLLALAASLVLLLQFMTPVSQVAAQPAPGTFTLQSVAQPSGTVLSGACYNYTVGVSTNTQQLINYLSGNLADVPLIDQVTGAVLAGAVNPLINGFVDPIALQLASAVFNNCNGPSLTAFLNETLGASTNLVNSVLNACLINLVVGCLTVDGALTAVGVEGLPGAVLSTVVFNVTSVTTTVPPTGYPAGTSHTGFDNSPFSLNSYAGDSVVRGVYWPDQDPGETETGETETGETETGETETGETETGETETGETETGETETGETETGETETGETETGSEVPTGTVTSSVYDCAEIGSIMLEYKNSTDAAAGSSGCEPGSASLTFTSVESGVTHTFVVGAGSAIAQMGMPLMQFVSPHSVTVNNSAAIELPAGDYTVALDGTNVSLAITVSEGDGNPNLVVTQLAQAQTDPTPGAAPSPTPGGVSGLPSTGSGFGGSHIVWPAAAAAMVLMLLAGQFVVGTVRNRK